MEADINQLKTKNIAVLYGGNSPERNISLESGKNIFEALVRKGYSAFLCDPSHESLDGHNIDIAFIALHGIGGEDGTIQRYFTEREIPYTGAKVCASETAMNKLSTKKIMEENGLPTACYTQELNKIPFDPPWILKPISSGSSIGIQVINSLSQLRTVCNSSNMNIEEYFIEQYISGTEVTVGLLEINSEITALPILELQPKAKFYDFKSKYTPGETKFVFPSEETLYKGAEIKPIAQTLFRAINCRGLARVDMIVCPKKGPMVLEINTIPGMTALSDVPAQAKKAGISFDQLVEIILLNSL